ncbi:MAG: DUF1844 domain-containing protein [Candidatus Acidiferrales bacterium]
MADTKHDETFKVVDRRLFTAEGELREEVAAEEKIRREEPPAAPKVVTSAAPAAGPVAVPSPQKEQTAPEPPADATEGMHGFESLVNFVAQNAAMLLGAYPDPRSGQPMLDLEGARELIDMLDALREKTRGHLTPEEDRLLLDVLGSLKLTFMEMTKVAAQAMQEKAKSRT